MKVEVKEQETFQPITLTITIESEEELCDLYLRYNQSHNNIMRGQEGLLKHKSRIGTTKLWDELRSLINKYNLRK